MMGSFALPQRSVIQVSGTEARSFLETLVTCRVADVAADAPRYGALLTPQGKILFELFFFDDGAGGLFLDAPGGEIEALLKRLALYKLRAKVDIIDRRGDLAVVQDFASGGGDPRGESFGERRIVAAHEAAGPRADQHEARIRLGLPEQGADYGPDEIFPTDVNLDVLHGVDYAKGCFVGQEVVSRMKRRGTIRKRTMILEADGAAPERTDILAGEARIGSTLSAAGHAALALVRLDRLAKAQADAAPITVGGAPARLRFPDAFPDAAKTPGETV